MLFYKNTEFCLRVLKIFQFTTVDALCSAWMCLYRWEFSDAFFPPENHNCDVCLESFLISFDFLILSN